MSDPDARVVDLELRFMKLERLAEELSDVVHQQRREIDALTAEVRRLRDRLSDEGAEVPDGERPPHY